MDKYNKIVELLTSKEKFHINLGLDRVQSVLDLVGNPETKLKCIQVAGTNGKGSVCAIINSVLVGGGYKVGLFTSPHIFRYNERIKISNQEIPTDILFDYLVELDNISQKNEILLTEFELLTVVMFKYFADNNVDIVVLETGLGGRLDATNVVEQNLCSIITHIDLDHTERLGVTKDEIAEEKAGIIKQGCPVITSEGYEAIKDMASEKDSLFIMTTPFVEHRFLEALSLRGVQQQENLALALEAIKLLFKDIDDDTIIKGLQNVSHIGRFQYIKEKNLIIDGSHNPNSIDVLQRNLNYYFPNTKRQFIFGALKNKNYSKMLDILFSFKEYGDEQPKIYFYQFNNENACSFEDLQEQCIYFSRELKSPRDVEYSGDVLTVVCGSLYMLSEFLPENSD